MSTQKLKLKVKLESPLPERKFIFVCQQRTIKEMKNEIRRRILAITNEQIVIMTGRYELMDDDEVADVLKNKARISVHLLASASKLPDQTQEKSGVSASAARNARKKKQRQANASTAAAATATTTATATVTTPPATISSAMPKSAASTTLTALANSKSTNNNTNGSVEQMKQQLIQNPVNRHVIISLKEHGTPNNSGRGKQAKKYLVQKMYDECAQSDDDSESEQSSASSSSDSDAPPSSIPLKHASSESLNNNNNSSSSSSKSKNKSKNKSKSRRIAKDDDNDSDDIKSKDIIANITLEELETMVQSEIENISAGSIIAYKAYEISPEMVPVLSPYRIAHVKRVSFDSGDIVLKDLRSFGSSSSSVSNGTNWRRQKLLGDEGYAEVESCKQLQLQSLLSVKILHP